MLLSNARIDTKKSLLPTRCPPFEGQYQMCCYKKCSDKFLHIAKICGVALQSQHQMQKKAQPSFSVLAKICPFANCIPK
jgi:hypothetical protein